MSSLKVESRIHSTIKINISDNNIGLVSLISLGYIGIHMCGLYYSIMCTTHPAFVRLLFVPSLYSTF